MNGIRIGKSPLVPGAPVRLLNTLQVPQLIRDWIFTYDIDVSSELEGIETIQLYRCEVSQLDFFVPHTAVGSSQLYQSLQRFDWYHMRDKWEFRQAIKELANSKRILEVGCGLGYFVEMVMNQLSVTAIKGIELNGSAAEIAIQRNIPVERVHLEDLVARGETFDAVCSFQVLEHSDRPRDFVESMVNALVPGGKLIISVPNREAFLQYEINLLDMPPHHMTRWNAYVFKYLENLFPLRLMRIYYEPLARYHIPAFVTAYGQHWCGKLYHGQMALSAAKLQRVARWLEKSRLYRLLRGHTLFVVFQKL